jgi:hypothetical protein
VPWPRRPAKRRSLCGEARFRSHVSPCEVSGAPSSSATGFCSSTLVFARIFRFLSEYLGFRPSTSVFVRELRFLSEYFGFCQNISVFVRVLLFLSVNFGFCPSNSVFVGVLRFFVRLLRFLSEYFGFCPSTFGFCPSNFSFPLPVPFHQCSILHLHVALTGRTNEHSLGTFQTVILARKSGSIGQNRSFTSPTNG